MRNSTFKWNLHIECARTIFCLKFYKFKLEELCVNSDLELFTVEFLYWFLNFMETVILSQEKSQKEKSDVVDDRRDKTLINL